jgi:hypothetical protein
MHVPHTSVCGFAHGKGGLSKMKLLSEKKALVRLRKLISDFKSEISNRYEHRSKSCLTCDVRGSCCLDAHFVNVHISRLEAVNIRRVLDALPEGSRREIDTRIDASIEKYGLNPNGDTFAQTFACPLFEKEIGCLVHTSGKPVPCITHACYENPADLPPDELQATQEERIDALNEQTYGRAQPWLPLPLALSRNR